LKDSSFHPVVSMHLIDIRAMVEQDLENQR
jgi:hypothetical protein